MILAFMDAPREAAPISKADTPASVMAFGLPLDATARQYSANSPASSTILMGTRVDPLRASCMDLFLVSLSCSESLGRARASMKRSKASQSFMARSRNSFDRALLLSKVWTISSWTSAKRERPTVRFATIAVRLAAMEAHKAEAEPPPGVALDELSSSRRSSTGREAISFIS